MGLAKATDEFLQIQIHVFKYQVQYALALLVCPLLQIYQSVQNPSREDRSHIITE
jgi:hypothetical protein